MSSFARDRAADARRMTVLVMGLDRCRHGVHEDEPCEHCTDGLSQGNPHLRTGQPMGYDVDGTPLYLPAPRELGYPEAWRKPPQALA
ncbi:hypothetical protein AB0O47_39780 [Streptomyces noursei]|uniref:hypothetical protein n=1 Tax=Streptomyces noursei TaxID=1971 RepID=UPI00344E597D